MNLYSSLMKIPKFRVVSQSFKSLCYNCLLQALIEKTNVNPSEVGDIVVGTVLAPGSQRATECRMAAIFAGFPGTFICILTSIILF